MHVKQGRMIEIKSNFSNVGQMFVHFDWLKGLNIYMYTLYSTLFIRLKHHQNEEKLLSLNPVILYIFAFNLKNRYTVHMNRNT